MNVNFSSTIEQWYSLHRRELPWRQTRDPYRIWVSEIILQQTRVAQGMEYYHRFIARFPDVRSLAEAEEDDVLRLWQGLGYYSRARNMHKAARQVMELGGCFPDTFEGVRRLAGIGDYTAAAIMSFAYEQPYAVLDGNVFRVLSRVLGIDTPIDSTGGKKIFAALAQEMMDTRQPSLYNQAIMDFGALQCTPKGYDCPSCPLMGQCVACAENRVGELPVKSHKTAIRRRHLIYIYTHEGASDSPCLLLHRRGKDDIWEGLYELPLIELPATEPDTLPRAPWLEAMMQDGARLECRAQEVRHQLTHQLLLADCYELTVPFMLSEWLSSHASLVQPLQFQSVSLSALDRYGMPRLVLQLLAKCGISGKNLEI